MAGFKTLGIWDVMVQQGFKSSWFDGTYTDGLVQYSTLTFVPSASTATVGICHSQQKTVNSCWFAANLGADGYKKAFSAFLPSSYIEASQNLVKDVATDPTSAAAYLTSFADMAT
jgi:hypothetical protein